MSIPQLYAQTSGGQIVRQTQSTKKKLDKRKKTSTAHVKSEQTYQTPPPPPNIQPISIEELSTYSIVVFTMSIVENAQRKCQALRDLGYPSQLYLDKDSGLYRIIIGSTNNEQEALSLREVSRKDYPDAWILYIVNGKKERYY